MEIIGELEGRTRGVYAGAVGYASFAGSLDTCIAIRTMVVKDGVAYLQAGGGIVYDSEPLVGVRGDREQDAARPCVPSTRPRLSRRSAAMAA